MLVYFYNLSITRSYFRKSMKKRLPNWDRISQSFLQLPIVEDFLAWSKTHSLPGFFKVPVYDVAVFLYNESQRVTLVSRANAMAFSFFLSLFPAIIFMFTVATLMPIYDNFQAELHGYIDNIMPSNAGLELKTTIETLVRPNTSMLSLGFILTLYFASNGMLSMMEGFEKTHLKTFKARNVLMKRLIAIGLTLQLGVLVVSSILLIILGNYIIGWVVDLLDLTLGGGRLIELFRWIIFILLFYFGVALIYRYGAAMHRRLKWFTPGATLATVLSIISSLLFSLYVETFGTYNKIYGPIGTIMVLMLWIQINCFILLVGFELNASIAVNRDLKKEVEEE